MSRIGLELRREADHEELALPLSGGVVRVPRLHPAWALRAGPPSPFAGIPSKRLVTGPAAVDGLPPELGRERQGVGPAEKASTVRSDPYAQGASTASTAAWSLRRWPSVFFPIHPVRYSQLRASSSREAKM